MIENFAHLESVLDEKVDAWYNEDNDEISERTQYEENSVYLPWQASRCWRIMRNITAELAQIATNEINDLYR